MRSTISRKHFVQIDMQERDEEVYACADIKTKKVSTSGAGIVDEDGEDGVFLSS